MQLFEMQGLLAGKCLPGDMLVGESLAKYLLRHINQRDELARQVSALQTSQDNIINGLGIKGDGPVSKLVIEYVLGLVAENVALRELIEQHAAGFVVCENCHHEEPCETDDIVALYRSMDKSATDAAIAEIRVKAIEGFVSNLAYRLRTAGGGDGYHSNPYHECADLIELKGGDYVEALRAGDNP